MGSLSGRPKAPSSASAKTQIVYVSQPSPAATVTEAVNPGEASPEERASNILQRSRSRLGTVLSSFRGVLSQNDMVAQRKTLLGE